MSLDPKGWTADLVRAQLQNAVYLEMWTIPLYLTAAYSIMAPVTSSGRPEFAAVPTNADGSPDFSKFTQQDYNQYAFNVVLSVAIQEMLHVELASNILNAVRPQMTISQPWVQFTGQWAPDFTKLPPNINGSLPSGVTLELGPMNLNQALLFQWIEHDDPTPPVDPYAYQQAFHSIGDFYTALQYGVMACWSDLYPPQGTSNPPTPDELFQKDDWGSIAKGMQKRGMLDFLLGARTGAKAPTALLQEAGGYGFSIKIYGDAADAQIRAQAAMTAIKVQGEGAGAGGDVPPIFRPSDGDQIEITLDAISHYTRFTELVGLVQQGKIQTYNEQPASDLEMFQRALNQSYSSFLSSLDSAFSSTVDVGIDAMRGLGNRTLQVWQQGGTPTYTFQDPSSYIDPGQKNGYHACQGLDSAGTSQCATAFYHACSTTNMCAGQGGCGYAGDPGHPDDDWKPNFNSCKNLGGCGAPIPENQVFTGGPNKGENVWQFARKSMGFDTTTPANDFRSKLSPTS